MTYRCSGCLGQLVLSTSYCPTCRADIRGFEYVSDQELSARLEAKTKAKQKEEENEKIRKGEEKNRAKHERKAAFREFYRDIEIVVLYSPFTVVGAIEEKVLDILGGPFKAYRAMYGYASKWHRFLQRYTAPVIVCCLIFTTGIAIQQVFGFGAWSSVSVSAIYIGLRWKLSRERGWFS